MTFINKIISLSFSLSSSLESQSLHNKVPSSSSSSSSPLSFFLSVSVFRPTYLLFLFIPLSSSLFLSLTPVDLCFNLCPCVIKCHHVNHHLCHSFSLSLSPTLCLYFQSLSLFSLSFSSSPSFFLLPLHSLFLTQPFSLISISLSSHSFPSSSYIRTIFFLPPLFLWQEAW